MPFNSFTFILFFALVFVFSRLIGSWTLRKAFLVFVSYIFYAAWNPPFVILLWISTVADWVLANWISRQEKQGRRRFYLTLSVVLNLGLLAYFKYGNFLLANFTALLNTAGMTFKPAPMSILLPVGISFYTFQTLSYTFDVYRRKIKPWPSLLDYALYVTFFAHLVAGPILKSEDFLMQCQTPRKATHAQAWWGIILLITGLFSKMVLADAVLAQIVERVYDGTLAPSFHEAWLATFAFALQIFFDFSGYSTCAVGIALALGFFFPENFRFPYGAVGFSDFWRRWHISFSTWLRDYLYIPLGGNRAGKFRTYFNLMLTMLIGGLWHGASWMFVIWGGLHGFYLAAERLILKTKLAALDFWKTFPAQVFLSMVTFLLVCVAWVFFRAKETGRAFLILQAMAGTAANRGWPLLNPRMLPWVLGLTALVLVSDRKSVV